MVKFNGNILQLGFGAVGKSFFEKVPLEIEFDEYKYFVISRNHDEFDAYLNLGAIAANFITQEITSENFRELFAKYVSGGDIIIDFAESIGTNDLCDWCAQMNIMYLNTASADWPEYWLDVFQLYKQTEAIREKHRGSQTTNKHPIVLQHGNNPGLVSHFVKLGIEYIIKTQKRKDKHLHTLIGRHRFNEAAQLLGVRMIHINDIDLQKTVDVIPDTNPLINTWCIDTFLFEMLTEASFCPGTFEIIDYDDEYKIPDDGGCFLEFTKLAADMKYLTYYPGGVFEGYPVPHDEVITVAKSLEVTHDGKTVYRPTVMFIYSPCTAATEYIKNAKVNSYPEPDPEKPQDCEGTDGQTIVRGHIYPENAQIAYRENVTGTEYVGVLLLGDGFDPVWVGNRVEPSFLYKDAENSYWQTPTITPVSMSALAAVCRMIKNKDKGGIYFPDDISDYKSIVKIAEKYISKTIYKTFKKDEIENALNIDLTNLQAGDFFVSG